MLEASDVPRVAEFYHGKSVFLTGAAGFIASVLLETLLRCGPGIKFIYILLRTKKKVQPEDRKEQIFNKKIFEKLKKETPELLKKVCVISGDVSLPNLGINEDDTHLLLKEVSIVFHCAAVVNFKKPLEFLLKNNVLGLSNIIELCRKMRKFEVLVYTSTAYSNCNHLNFPLKEQVYRLPFHAGKFLDALKNGDNEKLRELVVHCKPDWPNLYSFSKCLAENVIMDTASDLPVAIVRPSIVFSTWKHPIPIGKGFIKVVNADSNCKLNFVPADIVANAHVLAAWCVGTKRCTSPLIANCTATENLHIKIYEYAESIYQLVQTFPLPQSFAKHTNLIIVPCKYLYYITAAFYHHLPAFVLDGVLRILRKKPRIYSLYRFFDTVMSAMKFFWFHSFEFEKNNFEHLDKLIHPEDRKDLTLDFRDATFLGMALSLPKGSSFYNWKLDKKSQWERQRTKLRRHIQISCIQGIFLIICFLLIYWVISSIIR
ncbi:unnamed protein product [Larinioides sclopetarius]|uniref:Fatty acyl-CoA reductase n=2 Tax=Larinioides sclopetarius TaxID=280406 RepID=A0AAV2B2L6_9ARAC